MLYMVTMCLLRALLVVVQLSKIRLWTLLFQEMYFSNLIPWKQWRYNAHALQAVA